MGNDTSSLGLNSEPQTVSGTNLFHYGYDGLAKVNFPIYDIYGRFSRYEVQRMNRRSIEEYNRKHKTAKDRSIWPIGEDEK